MKQAIFKRLTVVFLGILPLQGGLLQSCLEPQIQAPLNQVFLITQEQLDKATLVNEPSDTLILGNPFGERESEARNNFRDILTSYSKFQQPESGDIIVIQNFTNNNGQRGNFLFVDVMIKREIGYNVAGNDFEYIRIPYDSTVNYSLHPNGILPDLIKTSLRGDGSNILSVNCVTCHNRTSDFLFFN